MKSGETKRFEMLKMVDENCQQLSLTITNIYRGSQTAWRGEHERIDFIRASGEVSLSIFRKGLRRLKSCENKNFHCSFSVIQVSTASTPTS